MIYFIRGTVTGAIKIGYTGKDPSQRLRELQTGSPEPLVLIGGISGGVETERRLHDQFATHRLRARGEWFRGCAELLDAITALLGTSALLAGSGEGDDNERFVFPASCVWPGWATPHNPARFGIAQRSTGRVFLDGEFVGLSPYREHWIMFGYEPDEMIIPGPGVLLFHCEALLGHAHGIGDDYDDWQDWIISTMIHRLHAYACRTFRLPVVPFSEPCDCAACVRPRSLLPRS